MPSAAQGFINAYETGRKLKLLEEEKAKQEAQEAERRKLLKMELKLQQDLIKRQEAKELFEKQYGAAEKEFSKKTRRVPEITNLRQMIYQMPVPLHGLQDIHGEDVPVGLQRHISTVPSQEALLPPVQYPDEVIPGRPEIETPFEDLPYPPRPEQVIPGQERRIPTAAQMLRERLLGEKPQVLNPGQVAVDFATGKVLAEGMPPQAPKISSSERSQDIAARKIMQDQGMELPPPGTNAIDYLTPDQQAVALAASKQMGMSDEEKKLQQLRIKTLEQRLEEGPYPVPIEDIIESAMLLDQGLLAPIQLPARGYTRMMVINTVNRMRKARGEPPYDAIGADAGYALTKNITVQSRMRSIDVLIDPGGGAESHYDTLIGLSNEAERFDTRLLNRPWVEAMSELGNPKYSAFITGTVDIALETAMALTGSSATTDTRVALILDMFHPSLTTKQIVANVEFLKKMLTARRAAWMKGVPGLKRMFQFKPEHQVSLEELKKAPNLPLPSPETFEVP